MQHRLPTILKGNQSRFKKIRIPYLKEVEPALFHLASLTTDLDPDLSLTDPYPNPYAAIPVIALEVAPTAYKLEAESKPGADSEPVEAHV